LTDLYNNILIQHNGMDHIKLIIQLHYLLPYPLLGRLPAYLFFNFLSYKPYKTYSFFIDDRKKFQEAQWSVPQTVASLWKALSKLSNHCQVPE